MVLGLRLLRFYEKNKCKLNCGNDGFWFGLWEQDMYWVWILGKGCIRLWVYFSFVI